MTKELLRDVIELYLRVRQADFAFMLKVSNGAVAQWLSGARPIPGPVSVCVDLLMMMPDAQREKLVRNVKEQRKAFEAKRLGH